jgi:hypothetical protein
MTKQRDTAGRIRALVVDEHGVTDISYSTVRDKLAGRLPEILAGVRVRQAASCTRASAA